MSDEMDEIWTLYADDGAQALDAAEAALEALASGAGSADTHISALFRAVHTFKGNSRVLGLAVVESRAHLAEDLIGLVRDEGVPLSQDILDVLILASDHLREMLEQTAATRADVAPEKSQDLMDALARVIAQAKAGPSSDAAPLEQPDIAATAASNPAAVDPTPEDPAPEDPMPEAPAPQETAGSQAAPAASLDRGLLDADPVYRSIFTEMVEETLDHLLAAGADPDATCYAKADALAYAAGQFGLSDWIAALEAFAQSKDGADGAAALSALCAKLSDLRRRDLLDPEDVVVPSIAPAEEDAAAFAEMVEAFPEDIARLKAAFESFVSIATQLAEMGQAMGQGEKLPHDRLAALMDELRAQAAPFDFLRLVDAGARFAQARDLPSFRMAQFGYFEELAAIERSLPEGLIDGEMLRPSVVLGGWAADHIFDTLTNLRLGLDGNARAKGKDWFPDFEGLMRRAYHACRHYRMDVAAQLTMALIDLFARMRAEERAPDIVLLQIARGFVDTMDLVFDALGQGDTPDVERIERLFEEAANICFVASGVVTARTIEERLSLPKSFHRVLSPESVKSAQTAIDAGLRFYILRADLNEDDGLAEKFLHWVSTGNIRMITNVTVFEGDRTLFDFLLAAPLPHSAMDEAVVDLDPKSRHLKLLAALEVKPDPDREGAASESSPTAEVDPAASFGAGEGLALLDAIGEIAAGQALVSTMLVDLAKRDLFADYTERLRAAGLGQVQGRMAQILRETCDAHEAGLRAVQEAEVQLSSQLAQLQERSIALRSRPASSLLRPLQTFVQTEARRLGHEARLSVSGEDHMMDHLMIEDLRSILKRVFLLRLSLDQAPRKFHLVVQREEDQVAIELTDDGTAIEAQDALMAKWRAIETDLSERRGTLRQVALPAGGVRLHLSLPLHMIVLEGMVVKSGGVNYVLPVQSIQRIHQGRDLIPISAAQGSRMLRLDQDKLVPIRPLDGRLDTPTDMFVVVQNTRAHFAIPVDALLGQQLVLLRPLRGVLSGMRDVTGVAILSGGEVGMVVAVSRMSAAMAA